MRLIVGADHRVLLPLSALAGGLFLLVANAQELFYLPLNCALDRHRNVWRPVFFLFACEESFTRFNALVCFKKGSKLLLGIKSSNLVGFFIGLVLLTLVACDASNES
ncbi:MAG: hypothetical protein CM1200mP39_20880 [Dehalococcoidia bacterium]|nr:MAG: hypothetical protein CM1200mP39_20880 [Dehalococcoidia bacterium]